MQAVETQWENNRQLRIYGQLITDSFIIFMFKTKRMNQITTTAELGDKVLFLRKQEQR